jgi:hypothetical protein
VKNPALDVGGVWWRRGELITWRSRFLDGGGENLVRLHFFFFPLKFGGT